MPVTSFAQTPACTPAPIYANPQPSTYAQAASSADNNRFSQGQRNNRRSQQQRQRTNQPPPNQQSDPESAPRNAGCFNCGDTAHRRANCPEIQIHSTTRNNTRPPPPPDPNPLPPRPNNPRRINWCSFHQDWVAHFTETCLLPFKKDYQNAQRPFPGR